MYTLGGSSYLQEGTMFIIKRTEPENCSDKLAGMYARLEKIFGKVPPHFELLASINPDFLAETLSYLQRLMNHPHIPHDFFAFLRLHVAGREGYDYCIQFNTSLLKKSGYGDDIISKTLSNIYEIPLEIQDKELALKAIKAIYDPRNFCQQDLKDLYGFGWNDEDIYDAINHAGFLLKNGRMISCYLE